MLQGKVDQIMMNASIGIRQIEPAHSNGAMFKVCLVESSCNAPRHSRDEGLLDSPVHVPVSHHEGQPAVLEDGGEHLSNA